MPTEAVRSILARALPPAELLERVEPLLDDPSAAALLPELLNALGVVADADPANPLADGLLEAVERLAPLDPASAKRALREALGLGWLFAARRPLLALLGEHLSVEALVAIKHADAHERRRGLALLCVLDHDADEVAMLDVEGASRLEPQRAEVMAGWQMERLISLLSDARPSARMRAEAALGLLGENAAPAAKALLRLPPWPGEDGERPSPVLYAIPSEIVRTAMEGEERLARRRGERVLGGTFAVRQTIPLLRIFSVEKAREFYVGFLGFSVDWEHRFDDQAPLYMQVSRAGLVLHLSEHHGDCCPGSTVFLRVTGLEAFHREISAKGYGAMRPAIERTFHGSRGMEVIDPFGNRLRFDESD